MTFGCNFYCLFVRFVIPDMRLSLILFLIHGFLYAAGTLTQAKEQSPSAEHLEFSSEMSDHYWRHIVMSATVLKRSVSKQTFFLTAEPLTYGVAIRERLLFRVTQAAAY